VAIKAFIFDIDGTLLDSVEPHINSWIEAFNAHGYRISRGRIHRVVGMGSDKMIPLLTGLAADAPEVGAIKRLKAEIYESRHLYRVRPLPGVSELLQALQQRGIRLAVASSATGEKLDRLLELAECADDLPCESCIDGRSKPDPDKVLGAARWLGLDPADCVVVGDSPFDAQAAAAAGALFIGLRSGGRIDSVLAPALAVFDDPAHLAHNLDPLLTRRTCLDDGITGDPRFEADVPPTDAPNEP
jgi:HAD superfamily hydrolase (TIGR01509 family)